MIVPHCTMEWWVAVYHTVLENRSFSWRYGKLYCTSIPSKASKSSIRVATNGQKHLRYYSTQWLMPSIWPSICGWYAKLSCSLVPDILKNSCKKLLIKTGSRTLTMDLGMLCSLRTPSINFSAILLVVKGWVKVRKWADLLSLLMTTMMIFLPCEMGNLLIKSSVMLSHT